MTLKAETHASRLSCITDTNSAIERLKLMRDDVSSGEKKRWYSIAITHLEEAQMALNKAFHTLPLAPPAATKDVTNCPKCGGAIIGDPTGVGCADCNWYEEG